MKPAGWLSQAPQTVGQAGGDALGDAIRLALERFVLSQVGSSGGFVGRRGQEDPYYALFGVQCLAALGTPVPAGLRQALRRQSRRDLGFVERLAFIRLAGHAVPALGPGLLRQVEQWRAPGGGYDRTGGKGCGDVYDTFLAVLPYEDQARPLPREERLRAALESGALSPTGRSAPRSAAHALLLTRYAATDVGQARELVRSFARTSGGFAAAELTPQPDLLSTATCLLALHLTGGVPHALRAGCLEFVERCWCDGGGFSGHPDDALADVEYSSYGLMALGCLVADEGVP